MEKYYYYPCVIKHINSKKIGYLCYLNMMSEFSPIFYSEREEAEYIAKANSLLITDDEYISTVCEITKEYKTDNVLFYDEQGEVYRVTNFDWDNYLTCCEVYE